MKPLVYTLSVILLIFISVNFNSETGPKLTGNLMASPCGLSCSNQRHPDKKVTGKIKPGPQIEVGTLPFIDHLRGDLWGSSYQAMPREMGRKVNIKTPGDYLNPPVAEIPHAEPRLPDSLSLADINKIIEDMLKPDYALAEIAESIYNYNNICRDSTRKEYFGRFTVKNQVMSLGGWYGKFAVMGVYLPYDDLKGFLSAARKYFILPETSPDSVKITRQDSVRFYEYIDRDLGIRLRGFGVLYLLSDKSQIPYHTKVIEFTKYYDEEFVP